MKMAALEPESPNMTPMIDVVFQLLIFFMLSMHFPEIEGHLKLQLPKDKGTGPGSAPPRMELRVVICAGGDTRMHLHDKGGHERVDKNGEICKVLVEKNDLGELYKTIRHEDKAARNRETYRNIGRMVKELCDATPSGQDPPPVILDADSEVPYEHVIGIVNACKDRGVGTIEFVGNPRWDLYYGSRQRGRFGRGK